VGGKVVLGKYIAPPGEYLQYAENIGANALKVPPSVYNLVSKIPNGFRIFFNRPFLDSAIARGDQFLLSHPPSMAGQGSDFAWELDYMAERGFSPNPAGTELIAQSPPTI